MRVALGGWSNRIRERASDPLTYAGLTQAVKAAAAAVLAWVLATNLVGESQAFLAPWSAVLTVHATVYRSMSEGLRQVGASVAGVLVAFVFGDLIGFGAVTLGLAILVSLLIGRHPRFGNEGITVATTALVVLTTGIGDDSASLGMRLLDTAIGIVVGIAINVLVWPPLQDRLAAQRVASIDSRLGELLSRMASEIRAGHTAEQSSQWIDDVNAVDQRIDDAWALVRQAGESARFNFRGRRVVRREGRPLSDVLGRLEQAVAETRSMAGSLERQARSGTRWSAAFATSWVNLLWDVGQAVSTADTDSFEVLLWRIDDLAASIRSDGDREDVHWPVYGALLVNLRNITDSLDRVAEAHPIQLPREWRSQRPHVH